MNRGIRGAMWGYDQPSDQPYKTHHSQGGRGILDILYGGQLPNTTAPTILPGEWGYGQPSGQPQKTQQPQGGIRGAMGTVDKFINSPGGGFLMNLLAQSGYSPTPQSPFGAIGKASLMTQNQRRQSGMDELQRRYMESQIGLNQAKIDNPYQQSQKPPASIAEYNLYSEQTRAAGGEPKPFETWVKDLEALRAGGRAAGAREVSTPAQTAADQAYAPTYLSWTQGEKSDALKSISQLHAARDALRSGENITGKDIGAIPAALLPYANPKAANTKSLIEEVVQRNLRLVLGAQFTEQEGKRLIERAYDPALDEEFNAERLDRLIGQIELAVEAKNDQAAYYERHGTLQGWQGKTYTLSDFNELFEDVDNTPAPPKKGDVIDGYEFMGGDPASPNSWKKQ